MLTPPEITVLLDRYYSEHMGYPITELPPGGIVVSAYSAERREPGGGLPPDVRLMLFDDRALAAVRADLKPAVEQILTQLSVPAALLTIGVQSRIAGLVDTLPRENRQQVLYADSTPRPPRDTHAFRRLRAADLYALWAWFREVYPGKDSAGIMASAERSIGEGLAFAAYQAGRMVALARTLAPQYLNGMVEDIAVRTAEGFRRQGYAAALVAFQTQAILDLDRVPMYRCNWHNEASLGVALKLGFRRYASLISFMRAESRLPVETPEE